MKLKDLIWDLLECGICVQKMTDVYVLDVELKTHMYLKEQDNKILLFERYNVVIELESYRDLAVEHQKWQADRKYRGWTKTINPPKNWQNFYELAGFDWENEGVDEFGRPLINTEGG